MADNLHFVDPSRIEGDFLSLNQDESHHLCAVLRKAAGDIFWAADGNGKAYRCKLLNAKKSRSAEARILKTISGFGEPAFCLTLAVAIPKKDKFEWIIEKAAELGVTSVVPLLTSRTVMPAKALKPDRCWKIAVSAMKQCRRSCVLRVAEPVALDAFLPQAVNSDLRFVAHETESKINLTGCLAEAQDSELATGALCIGPEGGFSEEEIALAAGLGYSIVGLGQRRLRTETAAIVASGMVLAAMGEMS